MQRTPLFLLFVLSLVAVVPGCGLDDHRGRHGDFEGEHDGHRCDGVGSTTDASADTVDNAPLDATATTDTGLAADVTSSGDLTSSSDTTSSGDAVPGPGDASATACGTGSDCLSTQDCVNICQPLQK